MPDPSLQPDAGSVLNDRDLLRRFVQDADESAFAEIVRRHQGLVLGVCRRVMGTSADVEDAFQATFITLARRPRSVRNSSSLGSWLYTVAWRTSWRMVKKHRKYPVESLSDQRIVEPEDPLQRIASAQDCLVLDEELNHLPAKYREVLVMTYFSSQTSQQIADQLNVSKGTIDGRIREARNRLRIRLARRGVAIGTLAVAAGLCSGTSAMASTALLESTIQLGAQTLRGSVPGTTDLSHLEPFIQAETAMITTKTILTSLFCATAVVGIIGMNGLSQEGDGEAVGAGGQPPAQVNAVVAEAVDEVAAPAPLVELGAAVTPLAANKTPVEHLLMVYHLDQLDVDSTVATFDKLFANEAVTLKADARTNSMVAVANAEQHAQIKKTLAKLGEAEQRGAIAPSNNVNTLNRPRSEIRNDAFAFGAPDESAIAPLDRRVPELDFPGETQLTEVISFLATSGDVPLALDFTGNPIVSDIRFAGITYREALQQILKRANQPLDYEVRPNGTILIKPKESAFKLYPQDVRPAEKWLYDMLEQPVDLDFPGETPLSEILEYIATKLTADHGESAGKQFWFTIQPDLKELELQGFESLDDISIKDISFKNMALENALTFLFEQTDPELTSEIRNEVLVVTTREKAERSLVTRVYEVGHLLNLEFEQNVFPSGYTGEVGGGGMGGGGGMFSVQFGGMGQGGGTPSKAGTKKKSRKAEPKEDESLVYVEEESLASLIIEMTSPPCLWMEVDGDGGAIQQVGDTLVVRQTQEGHREIVRLLNLLTESCKK